MERFRDLLEISPCGVTLQTLVTSYGDILYTFKFFVIYICYKEQLPFYIKGYFNGFLEGNGREMVVLNQAEIP